MPSRSATVAVVLRTSCWGRSPTWADMLIVPADGVSAPWINRSSVVFPVPKAALRSSGAASPPTWQAAMQEVRKGVWIPGGSAMVAWCRCV